MHRLRLRLIPFLPLLPFLLLPLLTAAEPVRIIFDTDIGNDVDDALALSMLHALESRGEAKLLAVTITKDNSWAKVYVDLLDTYYGRPDVPIGVVTNGVEKEGPKYTRAVPEENLYPHRLTPDSHVADAVLLLRKTLAAQPDGSVVIVQVGFSTNLARLLESGPDDASPLSGRELVERKVKLLSAMAGRFSDHQPEYNVMMDVPSAKKVFGEWPTPLVTSGFEVGMAIEYPESQLASDFRWAKHHPLVDAFRDYMKGADLTSIGVPRHVEPLWDPTAALYAVRPDAGYYSLSAAGRIKVADNGATAFEPGEGKERYLIVDDVQKARVREAIGLLISQPPDAR